MEDRRFREIFIKGLYKNVDGNWEVLLFFKIDDVFLFDSKGYCLRRLLFFKRKFLNDNKLKDDYLVFMKKIFDNGYVSRVFVD